ncbi:MAG: hypothetical protein ACLFVU_05020 [Phycisphaerae bacterium]
MSILTKIAIVLLVVVSLFACAVFVTYATTVPKFRTLYQGAMEQNQKLAVNKQLAEVELQQLQRKFTDLSTETEDRLAELQSDKSELQDQLQQVRDERTRVQGQFDDMKAQLEQLAIKYDEYLERDKAKSEQLATARTEIDNLKKEINRQFNQIQETSLKLTRAEQIVTSTRRRLAEVEAYNRELEENVAKLREGGATVAEGDDERPTTEALIEGTITATKGPLVSINIGSAQGVEEGMKLIIHRADRFVGYMTVENVYPDEAAGIISTKQVDPLKGDKVTNKLER